MPIATIDGVKYLPYQYKDENQLEMLVKKHAHLIFGENSLFFERQKLKSVSDLTAIPDGFVLDLALRKWYIVEVELAKHPLYEHIVTQITKFKSTIQNPSIRQKLVNVFYDKIKEDPLLKSKIESSGIKKEQHKFLTDLISNEPEIIIIIDERTEDLADVCNTLSLSIKIFEFKTYCRQNVGIEVSIHIFDTLYKEPSIIPSVKEITISRKTASRYSEEMHLRDTPKEIRELYENLKDSLLRLGDNITIRPKKHYIAFVAKTNFVDVEIQKNALKIWFNLPRGELNDPKGLTRDVSHLGHWGNGDYELKLKDLSALKYVVDLAQQSYLKNS
jgi:predicted transport protein